MRSIIRWTLNNISRSTLHRVAGAVTPLLSVVYWGRRRRCPLCGGGFRRFLPYGYVGQRSEALCPRCLSLERHRMIWLWIERNTELLTTLPTLLHIAPEPSLRRHFRRAYRGTTRYITADLESPLADMHFDVQSIPLGDSSVDVVICNHLFEHVEDDHQAMREILRILRKGGWGVILSPIDMQREETFEDDTITDEAERTRIFGQYDHRRIYGRDYAKRLEEAGFEVYECDYANLIPAKEKELYALTDELLYIVRKP